jgi:hypothetical protein
MRRAGPNETWVELFHLMRLGRARDASKTSPFFELACVLMRFNHVARFVVNANHSIM